MASLAGRYADSYPMTLSPSPVTPSLTSGPNPDHLAAAGDRIALTLHLVASAPEFVDATRILDQKIASIGDEMEKAGFRRLDLKAGHYELRERRPARAGETDGTTFKVSRRLRLELSVDHALLDRFIAAITASSAEPALSLTFSSPDKGTMRTGIPAPAVAKALVHAETMVRAAGLSLVKSD